MAKATAKEVMDYFEESNLTQFMAEWKALSKEEQDWFKEAVGEVI